MNLYFVESIFKWVSLAMVSLMSLINPSVKLDNAKVTNNNDNKANTVYSEIVNYSTVKEYDSTLAKGTIKTVTEGSNGLAYTDADGKKVTLVAPTNKVIKVGTASTADYIGKMTGYGPDCEGCSLVGNVACYTKDHKNFSLKYDGIYYNDDTYGQVRILAAALSKFPCGSIIYVDNGVLTPFYGIVLDTGSAMRNAWTNNNTVWMDLAFSTEKEAYTGGATSSHVEYTVKRLGW